MTKPLRRLMFTDWLERGARVTRNPPGHLVSRHESHDELPCFRGLNRMRAYLERHGACYGAMQAAPIAWRRYQRRSS